MIMKYLILVSWLTHKSVKNLSKLLSVSLWCTHKLVKNLIIKYIIMVYS